MPDHLVAGICGAVFLIFVLSVVLGIAATSPHRSRRAPTDDNPAYGSDEELPQGGQRRTRRGRGFGRDGVIPSRHRTHRTHNPGPDRPVFLRAAS